MFILSKHDNRTKIEKNDKPPILTVEQAELLEDFNVKLQDIVLEAIFDKRLEPWMIIAVLSKELYNLNRTGEKMQDERK